MKRFIKVANVSPPRHLDLFFFSISLQPPSLSRIKLSLDNFLAKTNISEGYFHSADNHSHMIISPHPADVANLTFLFPFESLFYVV
jgi:hypothetical protein